MSVFEQQELRKRGYAEAMRYMDNAKENLQKAGKEDGYYNDKKYVRTACGTAYNGVLIALDTYLALKGIYANKRRKSIEFYEEQIGKMDRKLLKEVNNMYQILHLSGYYDGTQDVFIVKRGFDIAYQIINTIKPDDYS